MITMIKGHAKASRLLGASMAPLIRAKLHPLYIMPYLKWHNVQSKQVFILVIPSAILISKLVIADIIIKLKRALPSPLDHGTILHNGFAMADNGNGNGLLTLTTHQTNQYCPLLSLTHTFQLKQ